ncbi:MAG: response regulator [Planctomycetes bacterium]|nr:response regulator [Planctomycetota bacterium]
MAAVHVLDVGNCEMDRGAIRDMLLARFDVELEQVMYVSEALSRIANCRYALVFVNRLIFADGSPGIELVRRARSVSADPPPIMLISNFADAQADAVAAGAVPGIGKAALDAPETHARLAQFLPPKSAADPTPLVR